MSNTVDYKNCFDTPVPVVYVYSSYKCLIIAVNTKYDKKYRLVQIRLTHCIPYQTIRTLVFAYSSE